MTFPTIHLNGTSRSVLQEQYEKAYCAVYHAIEALKQTSPNGRDYYPQGPAAFNEALKEYDERVVKLVDVRNELTAIILNLCDAEFER